MIAILFIISWVCLITGAIHFAGIGPCIHNAWIYADEKMRERINKDELYFQSGFLFMVLGLIFMTITAIKATDITWMYFLIPVQVLTMIIFSVARSGKIYKKEDDE